ncbi:hypothetical protein D3C72_2413390 [compost metagenome]
MGPIILLWRQQFSVVTFLKLRNMRPANFRSNTDQFFGSIHTAHMIAADFGNNLDLQRLCHKHFPY